MKKLLIAGLLALATWTETARGQVTLGTPIAGAPACSSCTKAAVFAPQPGDYRHRLCQSSFVQLTKQMLAPVRLATGNLLPSCCNDTISRDDVDRMIADGGYSPAELAAARIKLDESQAGTRRAAVRYLASVNCHYYPEAEAGLIAALRSDRNECVRLEAALALGTCNCMTGRIADALSVAVSGCETDGNPGEQSERVRSAARIALARCHARGIGLSPQMLPPADWCPPTPAPMPMPLPGQPPSPYWNPMPSPFSIHAASSVSSANPQFAQDERTRAESVSAAQRSTGHVTGQRTLFHVILGAIGPRETTAPIDLPAPRRSTSIRPLGLTPLGSEAYLAIPNGGNLPRP